jgi:hypothetical protein
MVQQDQLDHKDQQLQMVQQDHKDQRVQTVLQDQQVHKDQQALLLNTAKLAVLFTHTIQIFVNVFDLEVIIQEIVFAYGIWQVVMFKQILAILLGHGNF